LALLESIMQALYKAYQRGEAEGDSSWYYDGSVAQELALVILDKADLIEHGIAIRGCWLTLKGVEVCKQVFK